MRFPERQTRQPQARSTIMWDFTQSMFRFSWAMSLFGAQQMANLANPAKAAKAFEDVTQAAEAELGAMLRETFRMGDRTLGALSGRQGGMPSPSRPSSPPSPPIAASPAIAFAGPAGREPAGAHPRLGPDGQPGFEPGSGRSDGSGSTTAVDRRAGHLAGLSLQAPLCRGARVEDALHHGGHGRSDPAAARQSHLVLSVAQHHPPPGCSGR